MQSLSVPTGDHNPKGFTAAQVRAALQGQGSFTRLTHLEEVSPLTLTVVDQGEDALLELLLAVDYQLHLFTNDLTITDSTTEGDLTEATFTGYSAITLTGGSWTVTAGDPAVGVYAKQTFTSTADQTAQTIYGYYLTLASSGALRWLEKFPSGRTVSLNGHQIKVTPRFTLAG